MRNHDDLALGQLVLEYCLTLLLEVLVANGGNFVDKVNVKINRHAKAKGKTRLHTTGIGFDGHTNYIASKSKLKGKIKYIISGMEALFYSQKFTILIDENDKSRRFITRLVIIANGKWEGGKYLVSPFSENSDGLVEVIILNDISRFRLAMEFIKLSLGKMLSVDLFTLIRTNQLDIRLDKSVYIHSDGEVQTPNQHIGVKVMDKKLKTIVSSF